MKLIFILAAFLSLWLVNNLIYIKKKQWNIVKMTTLLFFIALLISVSELYNWNDFNPTIWLNKWFQPLHEKIFGL